MRDFVRSRVLPVVAILVAAFAAGTSEARAQGLPTAGSIDVTPFLGITFGSDQEGAAIGLGGAIAYNYTPQIAFEGEIGILPDLEGETDEVDISVITFSGNVLYHFDTGTTLTPYATAGIGFGRTNFELAGLDDSRTELALNIGGGIKSQVNEQITVRGDLRYFNVNDENPNFWRLYGGVVFSFRR